MAIIPKHDLSQLRAQVSLLYDTEIRLAQMERRESHLKETVNKLRDGKVSPG